MNIEIISKCINSTGLLFDIAGAIFISWEVRNQFKGTKTIIRSKPKIGSLGPNMAGDSSLNEQIPKTEDSSTLKSWDTKKYSKMKIGLRLLVIGFTLQIVSSWFYLLLPKQAISKTISATIIDERPIIIRMPDSKIPPAGVIIKPPTNKSARDK